MRRIAPFSACLFAGAVMLASPPPTEASPLQPGGLRLGIALDDSLHLARRGGGGFRGGGGGFRGGMGGFRGGGGRAFYGGGGGRAFAYRGGGRAWYGGRAWRGGSAWYGGRAWRGGRYHRWRGGRHRVWRGPRWGWGWGVAPYYGYYGYGCPLVRARVWTHRGWRIRWVRRCYW
jgi:hypothetical protein